jgi:ABC-type dipeptide/oligopeptide/nickel transport system permease component
MPIAQILRRLVFCVIVVAGVAVITFAISHVIPGDPARMVAGDRASNEIVAHIRQVMGLDRSLPTQFAIYVRDLLSGDFGTSLRTGRPVAQDLRAFLPATLELGLTSLLLAVLVGVPLGVASAVYKDRPIDQVARTLSVAGISMPIFWLGLILILIFYAHLSLLPIGGRLSDDVLPPDRVTGFMLIDTLIAGDFEAFRSAVVHLILPAGVLGFAQLGTITRQIRASMLDALQEDYVRTARANGLGGARIVFGHALRNALIPSVTLLGLLFADLLYGAVLTETVFAWPGIGAYVVNSIQALDFPAIMGFTIIASVGYVLINLCVDFIYLALDPQLRRAPV